MDDSRWEELLSRAWLNGSVTITEGAFTYTLTLDSINLEEVFKEEVTSGRQ